MGRAKNCRKGEAHEKDAELEEEPSPKAVILSI